MFNHGGHGEQRAASLKRDGESFVKNSLFFPVAPVLPVLPVVNELRFRP